MSRDIETSVKELRRLRPTIVKTILSSIYIGTDQKDHLVKSFDKVYVALADALTRGYGRLPKTKVQQDAEKERLKPIVR